MKFKAGEVIPAGFAIGVTSWENDADDYQDNYLYNVPYRFLPCWEELMKAFSSDGQDDGMGNEDWNPWLLFDYCVENEKITPEFTNFYLGFEIPTTESEEEYETLLDIFISKKQYIAQDKIQKLLGTPVGYDSDFMRVAEKFIVYKIEEPIEIPAFVPIKTVTI